MFYELALISVVIACGYWGYYFLRHQPHGTPQFGVMQLAAAVLAGLGLLGRHYAEHSILGVLGAIGLGAGACLLVVGPFVRGVARRFAAAERTAIATRLLDVAEILAPGSGVAEEKALLGAMKEIREGRVEQAVDALTQAKNAPTATPDARLAVDERIAMLYLAAYRWSDAISYAEANLPSILQPIIRDEPPEEPLVKPPGSGSAKDTLGDIIISGGLRDSLGVAAPVWIELLGAYGRTGNLDQAAKMMDRLEEACRDRRDESSLWLHRARMMFLALAGRADSVRTLVDPKRARHMSAAARMYWMAVALQYQGDRDGATAAFRRARSKSRGRPRDLIDEAIARLPTIEAVTPSPAAVSVIERVEAAPLPPPIRLPRQHGPWATWTLTAAILGAAGLITWLLGSSNDPGVLLRSGAMVRGRIEDGEWWRLVSCMFVHVGSAHLIVNAIGIYFLGKVCEELFGTARTLVIFGVAGVAGATASCFASSGVSAGASGAIFGIMGALFIELTLHRSRYRQGWTRGMWGRLAVVIVAQVAIGFVYPVIDQWAHGAGLLAGVAIGAAMSPQARWAKVGLHAARAIAIVFVGVVLFAGVMVARTSIADSFGRRERVRYELREVAVTAPAGWTVANRELLDPDKLVILRTGRKTIETPRETAEMLVSEWKLEAQRDAKARGLTLVDLPAGRMITPDGWQGMEWIGTVEDAMGYGQRYRIVGLAKDIGGEMVFALLYAPDTVMQAAPDLFSSIVASVGPR